MLTSKIHEGRIEPEQPIPDVWEGLTVQVLPLLPEELADDLEQRLTALHDLGAAEFADGEEQQITEALSEMDRRSRNSVRPSLRLLRQPLREPDAIGLPLVPCLLNSYG